MTDTNRGTHPASLTNYINWINEDAINKGQNVKAKCDVPNNTGLNLAKTQRATSPGAVGLVADSDIDAKNENGSR